MAVAAGEEKVRQSRDSIVEEGIKQKAGPARLDRPLNRKRDRAIWGSFAEGLKQRLTAKRESIDGRGDAK